MPTSCIVYGLKTARQYSGSSAGDFHIPGCWRQVEVLLMLFLFFCRLLMPCRVCCYGSPSCPFPTWKNNPLAPRRRRNGMADSDQDKPRKQAGIIWNANSRNLQRTAARSSCSPRDAPRRPAPMIDSFTSPVGRRRGVGSSTSTSTRPQVFNAAGSCVNGLWLALLTCFCLAAGKVSPTPYCASVAPASSTRDTLDTL